MDIYIDRIKPLFDDTGLSVRDLAKEIGIPEKQIYNWNAGLAHSYRNGKYLEKISSYFGVSIGYLLGQDDDFVLVRKKTDEKTPAPPKENGQDERKQRVISLLDQLSEEQQDLIIARLEDAVRSLKALDAPLKSD